MSEPDVPMSDTYGQAATPPYPLPANRRQRDLDRDAAGYDGAANDYDLSMDPRCLWGWGSPVCNCRFGHACFRALGHPGKCGPADPEVNPMPCDRRQRPKDWDTHGRAEANR